MVNVYLSVVGRFVRYPRVLFLDCWCFDFAGQGRGLKWRIFMLSRVRWFTVEGGHVVFGETLLIALGVGLGEGEGKGGEGKEGGFVVNLD